MSDLVFSPSQTAALTLQYLEQIRDNDAPIGVPVGIQEIDDYLIPLRPTDMMAVLGRPGGGKSMLIAHLARISAAMAATLGDYSSYGPSCIVTAEMAIENYQVRELSNYLPMDSRQISDGTHNNWDGVVNAVRGVQTEWPTFYIGHSVMDRRRRPPMTIQAIRQGLQYIREEYGVVPSLLGVDYLQRLKLDGQSRDRRLEINEIVNILKDIALEFNTRVVLGVQAKREVDERPFPIPELGDGQESSAVEQVPEVAVSVMRPIVKFRKGEIIPQTRNNLVCSPELFFMKVLKQRSGNFGQGFWMRMQPEYARIATLETDVYGGDDDLSDDYL